VATIVGALTIVLGLFTFVLRDSEAVRHFIRDRAGTDAVIHDTNERIRNVENRLEQQLESFSRDLARISISLEASTATLSATAETVRTLVEDSMASRHATAESVEPCVRFEAHGHEASDAPPGGTIRVVFNVRKLRDCGFARHGVWIRNGASQYHACENISLADPLTGRMVALPAAPEPMRLAFTCTVPEGQDIHLGRAHVWLMPFYDGAPHALHHPSPEVPFNVLQPVQSPREDGAIQPGEPVQIDPVQR
jgi:hypothetical protein